MARLQALTLYLALTLLGMVPGSARAILFTSTDGTRSASADFTRSGSNLVVTLTNTATGDVIDPLGVLTAVFFDLAGPSLTPVSAWLNAGSTVWFGPDGAGNVGGEWAYKSELSGAPGGAASGISSSGFGLFGGANFGGANLQGPNGVDGLQYGLTSLGDDMATGNAPVTGGNALIHYSTVFTLGGYAGDPSADVRNVSFQYGTALSDPRLPPPVPEPATLVLFGGGLVLAAALRKRKA